MKMLPASAVASLALGMVQAMTGATLAHAAEPFTLSSTNFKDGGFLALKHAGANKANPNCVGGEVSPALRWSNAPADTKSFAFLIVDPQGRAGLGVDHWVAYGIPASVTEFAEGEITKPSDKYLSGKGTAGLGTYAGPCPPPGAPHHYNFTVIATDLDPKGLKPGLTRDELIKELTGHAKDAASLVGLFKHP